MNNTVLNPGSATSQDGPTISTLDRVNSPQMKCYSLLTHHQTRMIFLKKEHNPKDFDGFCVCVCFLVAPKVVCFEGSYVPEGVLAEHHALLRAASNCLAYRSGCPVKTQKKTSEQ